MTYVDHGHRHLPGGTDPIPNLGAGSEPGAWVTPTLVNGWLNAGAPFDTVAYRLDGDVLQFRGHITGGPSGSIAFYLASGDWPTKDLSTITDVVTSAAPGAAQIYVVASTGAVKVTDVVA